MATTTTKVKVAVLGAGWWTQGWHLPHLNENPETELVAIVDPKDHPQSRLNPNLEPLDVLSKKYNCAIYSSVEAMLDAHADLDGVIICTPHATHYELGVQILNESRKREKLQPEQADEKSGEAGKPIHILMEKPMTTDEKQAESLQKSVKEYKEAGGKGHLLVNHSASYRTQTKQAAELRAKLGEVRHVTAFFASPLGWIFDDPSHTGWNEPTGSMLGNGFGWGQMTHLVAWIWHVTGLKPSSCSCQMTHSKTTKADVSVAAILRCSNGAVISLSGTSILPGHAHSDPPVGKRVMVEIYGEAGALFYSGVDTEPHSGTLKFVDADGQFQVVNDSFVFENLDATGTGTESLQHWIKACQNKEFYNGADVSLGCQTIQTVAAMYKSHVTQQIVSLEERSEEEK